MEKTTPENIQSLFEKSNFKNPLEFADHLADNLADNFEDPKSNLLDIITAIQKFRAENDRDNKQYFNPGGCFCVKNGDFLEEGLRVGIQDGEERVYDKGVVCLWNRVRKEKFDARFNSDKRRKIKFKTHPITIEFIPKPDKEEETTSYRFRWAHWHHNKTIELGKLRSTYNGKTVEQPVVVSGTALGYKERNEKEFQKETPQLDKTYNFTLAFNIKDTFDDNPIVHIVSLGGNKKIRHLHFSTTCEEYYQPRDTVYEGKSIISFV